jgi:DNA-binding CsgD family transcriptional regulator
MGSPAQTVVAETASRSTSAWNQAARSVIDRLATDLTGTGVSVALTDANGHGVDSRAPGPWPRVRIPITDPNSGRTVGALALTISPATEANPLMRPLATSAAREIEQRLVDDAGLHERLALHRFLQRRRGAKGPFVLVTERQLITNAAGDRLVGPDDEPTLREAADQLRAGRAGDMVTLLLSGGPVSARAEVVPDNGSSDATILRLTPIAEEAPLPCGWASLTDTERSVAQIVAEGLTNREAAEHLFLSRHTVDFHLRSIFRKLGASSRVHLARLVPSEPSRQEA